MSNLNIRVATEEDVKELYHIMHEAFTPLRELGIDWPSVNADEEMVRNNMKTSSRTGYVRSFTSMVARYLQTSRLSSL